MFIIVIKTTAKQFNITARLIHWGSCADQAALSGINFQFERKRKRIGPEIESDKSN